MAPRAVLRTAHSSGSHGDRASALPEVLNDGPVHVVTGDDPAGPTMLVRTGSRPEEATTGCATTLLRRLEPGPGTEGLAARVHPRGQGVASSTRSDPQGERGEDRPPRHVDVPAGLLP